MEHFRGLSIGLLSMMLILITQLVQAQDIGKAIKQEPFKFSGSLSIGSNAYQSSRVLDRRSPFSYFIQSNPTFSFYGLKIPIVISIRDSKFNFSKRVNRIGLNPKYKWIQLMLGSNSYQFSPYTLSGQNINGVGVKLSPGKFRFTAMRGTMRNLLPQLDSLVYGNDLLPVYTRKALGVKVGFESSVARMEVIAFKAKDELDAGLAIQDTFQDVLTPKENLVLGLKSETTLAKIFTAGINIAGSVFTGDYTNDTIAIDESYQQVSQITLEPTVSTRFSLAGDVYGKLNINGFHLGLRIKQVEPFYQSLGLFYIQDDYRNTVINTSFPLLNRKIFITASYGIQGNNLRETRARTNKRNIRSLSVNYNSNSAFGLTANYSNYSQDQSPGLLSVNDTLRYAQISNNLSLTPRLTFSSTQKTQSLVLSLVQFGLEDLSNFYDVPRSSTSRITNLNYNVKWKESGFGFRIASNYNINTSQDIDNKRYGGTLGLSKKINKVASTSISSTYNLRSINGKSSGAIMNSRFTLRISHKKKNRFNLNLGFIRRSFATRETVNDLRANLIYTMTF